MVDYHKAMLVPSFMSLGLICESEKEECQFPLLRLLEGMRARGSGFTVISVGTGDQGDKGDFGRYMGL